MLLMLLFILSFMYLFPSSFSIHSPFVFAVPPSAPSAHISDTTSASLTVSWAAGDTGGAAVRAWAVWWRAAQGGGSWHTRELGRAHTRYIINDLQCGAEYQVMKWGLTCLLLPSLPILLSTCVSHLHGLPLRSLLLLLVLCQYLLKAVS